MGEVYFLAFKIRMEERLQSLRRKDIKCSILIINWLNIYFTYNFFSLHDFFMQVNRLIADIVAECCKCIENIVWCVVYNHVAFFEKRFIDYILCLETYVQH